MITVIIPTLPERKEKFYKMCERIKALDSDVTILSDDNVEKSIGRKRGELLAQVQTEYVMHIDDDDVIDDSMFTEIRKALESKPDAVAFKENQFYHGDFVQTASLGCKDGTRKEMGIVHRNPVKTSLAKRIGFYDLSKREDTLFGYELSFLLKDVSVIDKVLYYYYDEKDFDRNTQVYIEALGDPDVLGPQGKSIFNFDKYGKTL